MPSNRALRERGNSPNTLDSRRLYGRCLRIVSLGRTIDSVKVSLTFGRVLTVGDVAEIEATVYAYDPNADSLDLYYATDPSDPTWTLIGTAKPPGSGQQTIKMRYTLPAGECQAARAVFRYHGSASTTTPFQCPSSGCDDTDDMAATMPPTSQREKQMQVNGMQCYFIG